MHQFLWRTAQRGTRPPSWSGVVAAAYSTSQSVKPKHAPPQSVVNFRNMQRRRGGAFRTDVRVSRKSRHGPMSQLREHMYKMSNKIKSIAMEEKDPMSKFKEAESVLHERMQTWRELVRSMRARGYEEKAPPLLAAPAWNQVINMAIQADSPTAAWHLYCDMKRIGVTPTPYTYAGFFSTAAQMARAGNLKTLDSDLWQTRLAKMYDSLNELHTKWWNKLLPESDHEQVTYTTEVMQIGASFALAYRACISLLFALDRADSGMSIFMRICPDPYPGMRSRHRHGEDFRPYFSNVEMYTNMQSEIGKSVHLSTRQRRKLIREVWRRWQDEMLLASTKNKRMVWLDAMAVKTLVWTLSLTKPAGYVREVCALLGTYMGIPLPRLPGMSSGYVPVHPTVAFTDPRLLEDVLKFFDKNEMYRHVMCCFEFAQQEKHRGVDPTTIPKAVEVYKKAQKHL